VDRFGQRVSFFFNAHNDFLEEIAKFRAARRLWARIMKDRFRATHPRAQQLRFHTQTAGSTLTAQQPDNNIVRVALQALSPVPGAYAIERLTDDIERGAEELLARIERAGGTLAAIEAGLIQREIQESAYRAQLAVDAGEAIVVGVNAYKDESSRPLGVFTMD